MLIRRDINQLEHATAAHPGGERPIRGDGRPAVERGMILLAGIGRNAASLAEACRESGHAVATATTFARAMEDADRIRPDTIVVGADPTAGDSLEFLSSLEKGGSRAVRLLLSSCADPECTDEALAAGADDLVCPPHSARAILMRRQVLLRQISGTPAPNRPLRHRVMIGGLTIDLTSRQVLDGEDPLTLSGREFELLVRLMEGKGEVVPREVLLRDIWGQDKGTEAVLDATVHRLRRKLDEKQPEAELVTTVRGVGYRLDAPDTALTPALAQG